MRKLRFLVMFMAMLFGLAAMAEQIEIVPISTMEANPVQTPTPSPTPMPSPTPTPMPTLRMIATPWPTQPGTVATPAPAVTPAGTATPPVPTVAPAPGTVTARLMADTQGETTLSVGGLFAGGSTVLGSGISRTMITSVRFEESLAEAPGDAWDVSEARDGNVLAWVTPEGALTIAAEGGVRANANCSHLFAGYSSVTRIDFNGCFYTDDTVNMSHMFESCWSLTELDVSTLNTANVTDMSYMFSTCPELATLDLTGLNTGRVRSMEGMFLMDEKLNTLDLSGFDAAAATNMRSMFESCASLTQLDLSTLWLNSAVDMAHMFSNCAALKQVAFGGNLRGGDMTGMFDNCPAKLLVGGIEVNAREWAKLADYAALTLWSRGDDVRWLQGKLAAAGCDPGNIDGVFGPATEAALRKWQVSHGYVASGHPDAAQVWTMFKQR